MMFIVRTRGEPPHGAGVRIAAVRKTPDIVPDGAGQRDYFCVDDDDAPERLRGQGWNVVSLRDGWYQGDGEGGIAIWGQGTYWEVRDSLFSVKEAAGSASDQLTASENGDTVDVRGTIFGV